MFILKMYKGYEIVQNLEDFIVSKFQTVEHK